MPGMIAIAGRLDPAWERLYQDFAAIWQPLQSCNEERARMAAHAHRGTALLRDVRGRAITVDGEAGIYQPRKNLDLEITNPFAHISDGFLEVGSECKGNLLVADLTNNQFHFASEWTGTFPLYYLELDSCLLVSSHLRPLARAARAERDMTGIFEYLRFSYNIAGRTLFKRIRRTLPGQAFRYQLNFGKLEVRERSRLWTGVSLEPDPAEAAWKLLKSGIHRSIGDPAQVALMLSGGWDSRTLLAAAREELRAECLLGYSHGDIHSRELGLVRQLAKTAGIDCRVEAIDDTAYEREALETGFARVESVVFPHWHRAGVLLNQSGATTAMAGVYGEILGGHYGPAMRLQGFPKMLAVGRGLMGLTPDADTMPPETLAAEGTSLVQLSSLKKPWHVCRDAWENEPDLRNQINDDIAKDMSRLSHRGIETRDRLLEAYITEHRGTQYINMQLLSCRAFLDVALPFADQASLAHASRVRLPHKIHNRLNQRLLRNHNRSLLNYPLAATLLKADRPLVLQEFSRLMRRVAEGVHWNLHYSTKHRVSHPRLGWVNFEFLRNGKTLGEIVDYLSSDLWDHQAIWRQIDATKAGNYAQPLHPISDAMMKVLTVDLILR